MKSQLELIERQRAVHFDDQFAIDDELLRIDRGDCLDNIGEVTRQRLTGLRLQINIAAIAKRDAAKAVPLRLVLPLVASRNFIDRE